MKTGIIFVSFYIFAAGLFAGRDGIAAATNRVVGQNVTQPGEPRRAGQAFNTNPGGRHAIAVCAPPVSLGVTGGALLSGGVKYIASNERAKTDMLDAIARAESRGQDGAIGALGERGAYQIDLAAWTDVNGWRRSRGLPTWRWEVGAHHPQISRAYAVDYLSILRRRFFHHGLKAPTNGQLYAAYNMGFSKFQAIGFDLRRAPRKTRETAAAIEKGTR